MGAIKTEDRTTIVKPHSACAETDKDALESILSSRLDGCQTIRVCLLDINNVLRHCLVGIEVCPVYNLQGGVFASGSFRPRNSDSKLNFDVLYNVFRTV